SECILWLLELDNINDGSQSRRIEGFRGGYYTCRNPDSLRWNLKPLRRNLNPNFKSLHSKFGWYEYYAQKMTIEMCGSIWRRPCWPEKEDGELVTEKLERIFRWSTIWAPGPLEEKVQNIVKTWEMEMFHKVDFDDLKSVDPIKYRSALMVSIIFYT
ncbi:pathogenesis-related family protein, partial [Striga asiatica]